MRRRVLRPGVFPLLTVLVLTSSPLRAVEVKKEGWKFPNPAKATKKAIRPFDLTNRIPGRETLARLYQKDDRTMYETLEVEGEIFACQFHVRQAGGEPPANYAIVDTDGDGVFESKFNAGERADPPEWVIQRYYRRHPDRKDPGPPPGGRR